MRTSPDTIGVLANGTRKNVLTIKGEVPRLPGVFSDRSHPLSTGDRLARHLGRPLRLVETRGNGPPFLVAAEGSFPSMATTGTLIHCENSVTGLATLSWLDLESAQVTSATTGRFHRAVEFRTFLTALDARVPIGSRPREVFS